jgi:TRAP-type mannitol/chloroaromatic compound transport system permease small subunit
MSENPTYGSYGPTSAPPPTYLAWAIVATVLFFLPFGVVSIVFASRVMSSYRTGDYAGAQDASHKARTWALWSTIVGVVVWVVLVGLVVLGVLVGSNTSTSY